MRIKTGKTVDQSSAVIAQASVVVKCSFRIKTNIHQLSN